MKGLKLGLVILTAALLTIGLGGMAFAFHSGGVAECGGCHSMHAPNAGQLFLLIGSDQSSTCLGCHQHAGDTGPSSYHISTADVDMAVGIPPKQRTPGGDFGWLKKSYSWIPRSGSPTEYSLGERHGHNIIAADYGYVVDSLNTVSPGGSFSSSQLSCVSCHDPHGKYRRLENGSIVTSGAAIKASGSYDNSVAPDATYAVGVYRLLAGVGYQRGGAAPFPGVPAAVVPSTYNRTEVSTQTRVAYGHSITASGTTSWGLWCATCHGDMHSGENYVHKVDGTLGQTIADIYNKYVNSGNTTGGSSATSFLSLVPFIENTSDYTVLKSHAKNNNSYLNGPASSDRVSCLTCHRAHATGWDEMLRWNMGNEFMTYVADGGSTPAWPGTDTMPLKPQIAQGRLSAETAAAYYDRNVSVFGAYQRVLCNKCHAQD